MSSFVAYPAHQVEELLALLPPDQQSLYRQRFQPLADHLVWTREEAQRVLLTVLTLDEAFDEPLVEVWLTDPALLQGLTDGFLEWMERGSDRLLEGVSEGLYAAVGAFLRERLEETKEAES